MLTLGWEDRREQGGGSFPVAGAMIPLLACPLFLPPSAPPLPLRALSPQGPPTPLPPCAAELRWNCGAPARGTARATVWVPITRTGSVAEGLGSCHCVSLPSDLIP